MAAKVAAAIQGQLLVGHGLKKDLHSLGLSHPQHLIRDTMSFEVFQSRGHARKLKALALELLGNNIQMGRHRARWGCCKSSDCSEYAAFYAATRLKSVGRMHSPYRYTAGCPCAQRGCCLGNALVSYVY